MNTIQELLERLDEMENAVIQMKHHYKQLREQIIPPEIRDVLEEVDAEEKDALDSAQAGINALTEQVKELVIQHGSSVKSDHLHAVFTAGRTTWNNDILEGYAAAHPEIYTARKIGKPSVSIRAIR